jgi:hypothetical protein
MPSIHSSPDPFKGLLGAAQTAVNFAIQVYRWPHRPRLPEVKGIACERTKLLNELHNSADASLRAGLQAGIDFAGVEKCIKDLVGTCNEFLNAGWRHRGQAPTEISLDEPTDDGREMSRQELEEATNRSMDNWNATPPTARQQVAMADFEQLRESYSDALGGIARLQVAMAIKGQAGRDEPDDMEKLTRNQLKLVRFLQAQDGKETSVDAAMHLFKKRPASLTHRKSFLRQIERLNDRCADLGIQLEIELNRLHKRLTLIDRRQIATK